MISLWFCVSRGSLQPALFPFTVELYGASKAWQSPAPPPFLLSFLS